MAVGSSTSDSCSELSGMGQRPGLNNLVAIVTFVCTLFAFVAESQLTQYVESNLGYRQPFFIFYIVHSSFAVIFPLHLFYLTVLSPQPSSISALKDSLVYAINKQFAPASATASERVQQHQSQWLTPTARRKFWFLISWTTLFYTIPGLLWFASISLASITDVTAIWNANAFFAYVLTVKVFKLKFDPIKLFAVCLATLGTLCVVYGGETATPSDGAPPGGGETERSATGVGAAVAGVGLKMMLRRAGGGSGTVEPAWPLLGHLLTLAASVCYGLYQVLYKKYAALPTDPDHTDSSSSAGYAPVSSGDEPNASDYHYSRHDLRDSDVPPPPPFGLHPNLITSLIGVGTLFAGILLLAAAHYSGLEEFRLPSNPKVAMAIAAIAGTGVIFNAGFMTLLSVWGPILVSVGNLLTIVLVFISDILFGAGWGAMTLWSVVGSVGIVCAFGVLVAAGV